MDKEIKEGDKLKIVNCMEAPSNEGKIWEARGDEFESCSGYQVVFLKGYSGYFSCEFLEHVEGEG